MNVVMTPVAVWDYLISSSLAVLGDNPLRDLGQQFESEVQLSVAKEEGYNSDLAHAELGLRAVAQALGDVAMFERSYLIGRAKPNELQKEDIANFYLEQKDAVSALKWLSGEWQPRFVDRQYKLLDMAYVMMGRTDDLLQMRREAYNTKPSFERLDRKVVGYQSLVGKAEFDEELQALHGRKRTFWSLVT